MARAHTHTDSCLCAVILASLHSTCNQRPNVPLVPAASVEDSAPKMQGNPTFGCASNIQNQNPRAIGRHVSKDVERLIDFPVPKGQGVPEWCQELLYKGEEFEVQQLHIVEKLERAHEELAKQWQELDTERQRAQQQQEQQRERIQHFAREQAELQAGMKVQFESEVQKRYEWETQQQQLLKKRQEELEDQWQKEQQRRKQLWEKEQEEEFLKLQQRFYQLQRQFQEKLDSASHSQQGPSCNDFEAGEAHMQNKGEHRELAHVKDNSPNASHTRGLSRTEVKGSPSRPKASEPQECQETLEPPEPAEAKSLATLSSSLQPGQDLQEPLASGIDDWEVGSRFPMNPEQEGYEMQKTSFAEPRGRPMPPPEHRAKIQIGQASRTLEQQAKSMTAREKPDNISQNGVQHEDRQDLQCIFTRQGMQHAILR